MLDLQPRVHLQEKEVARLPVDEELAGARADVPHSRSGAHRYLAHPRAQLRRDDGRGRLLDHFLMTPLHAALPLAKPDAAPVLVREDLDLDVARPRDRLLDVDARVAERRQRLALRRRQRRLELLGALDEPHALAAAAGGSFQHDGVADLLRIPFRLLLAAFGNRLLQPGDDGNARFARLSPRARLLAHLLHRFGRWTDERDARLAARARERGVFAEESVPGMNRVRARGPRSGDHVLDGEVALARRWRPDAHGFVAAAHVQRGAIGVAEDGDGRDSHLATCTRDTDGDLAPVRDQDFADGHRARTSGKAQNLSRVARIGQPCRMEASPAKRCSSSAAQG